MFVLALGPIFFVFSLGQLSETRGVQRHAVDSRDRSRRRLVTEENQTTTAFHTVQTEGKSAGGLDDN